MDSKYIGQKRQFLNKAHYPSLHGKFGTIVSDYGKKEIFRFGFLFDGEKKPIAVSSVELGIFD